ncbi:putative iron compound ABC transporter iron compound binding protein [Methanocella paludicola SANAE]|uniref:Iron compound ABC transporter iron compound binding protein n=1 Tax=Methanocella paludicola (strain DSM 17711 / JCM 13418 / NBRC 101707 / SANAE) TaxID=304371 RepID=D1Z2R7_METPS|nr:helical backbone metal receptor [Methanocella paludicola]BAI62989.1 putative iron compound ABC transporter iron compound binding protein [Methanocella paludicola SANAE]
MVSNKNLTIIVSIALIVAALALGGCTSPSAQPTATPAASANYPMNVTDDKDRTVVIQEMPERIVSLSPKNTEMLYALGLGDKVVGVTDYCNYPAEAANKTKVGGITNVNVEQVGALNPDVVFADSLTKKEAAEKIESMGYPVIVNDPRNVSDIERSILRMGKVCGAGDNATRLAADINASIKAITDKTATLNESQRPKVLMLLDTYDFYVAGSDCYGNDLIILAGGQNVAYELTDYKAMSKEAVIEADPDIIIMPVDVYSQPDFEKLRNGTEDWMQQLSAVRNGKVYAVASDPIFRPGPRVVDAAQAMAKIIHPELFS